MNNIVSIRNEAKEIAARAIDYDNLGNNEEAFKTYIKAAEKLQSLIKIDENKYNKDLYKKKAMEYVQRAMELKKDLPQDVENRPPEESKETKNTS